MSGILYGVGVGPGDPELMTLKAVRLIRENDIIAVPGAEAKETVAYKIAVQAVPERPPQKILYDFPKKGAVSNGATYFTVFPDFS